MAYGRGGAGNIQALADATARAAADTEANKPPPGSTSTSESTVQAPKFEQQYAHSGRGGAGNYYSPKELSESGHFAGAQTSHILGDGTPAPAPTDKDVPVARTSGRGGVGNFLFGASEAEERLAKQKQDEDQREEALKKNIEKNVEEKLALPEKAKLPAEEVTASDILPS